MRQSTQRFILLICFAISLLLTSCSSHTLNDEPFMLSSADYLRLAKNATPPDQQHYLLLAADLMIQNHQLTKAQHVLNNLGDATLTADQQVKKQLLQASIYLNGYQRDRGLALLQNIEQAQSASNEENQVMLHQLLGDAYQKNGDLLASINQRSLLNGILNTPAAQQANLIQIWDSLQNVPPSELQALKKNSTSPIITGWLDLALIAAKPTNASQLFRALQQWRSHYANHPAEALLANRPDDQINPITTPKHIGLFLPVKGPLARQANAIRNGFFAAYYYNKKRSINPPTITVFDTSSGNIDELYHQATKQRVDFIVGPLLKSNVEAMIHTNSETPTLALNALANNRTAENFYQFGLSPLDEAKQAALRAWSKGKSSAIVISPRGEWGERVSDAFEQQWEAVGGKINAKMQYEDRAELANQIRKIMNISDADQRAKNLNQLLKEKLRSVPRRRQDVDMIFLAGSPEQAHQIVPLLKFYYAGNIPLYSISSAYNGTPDAKKDHDLNGLRFDDMPWILAPNTLSPDLIAIKQSIRSTWPTGLRQYPRLYALGVDAYTLIPQLGKLALLPQFNVKGATGTLYLDSNQHIYRKLLWAKMINGQPRLMAP